MKIIDEIKRLVYIDRKFERIKKGNIPTFIRRITDKFYQNKNCLVIGDGTYAIFPLKKDSIVYSGGLDADVSFELELIKKFDSKVYAFDPTKKCSDFMKKIKNKNLNYYNLGVSYKKGKFELDDGLSYGCISFVDFAKKNKHKKIDLIKLDIEGYEYKALRQILESDIIVGQIVIELHGWMLNFSKKEDKKLKKFLKTKDYQLVYKNLDNYTFVKRHILNKENINKRFKV
jgi:hypothetical protein